MRDTIQTNMARFFPQLSDSRIIAALNDDPQQQRQAMAAVLDDDLLGQPVLTASLALLAKAAQDAEHLDHWSLDRFERVRPGQVFNVVVSSV